VVLWIDHDEARLFRSGDEESALDIHSHTSLQRLHHRRAAVEGPGNLPEDTEFFERIVHALDHHGRTVLTGPGDAKVAFKAFLDRSRPDLAARVVAVEDPYEPDEEGLLALGRRHFTRIAPPRQPGSGAPQ
jgi:stalled ribosome rescue protein Dom34